MIGAIGNLDLRDGPEIRERGENETMRLGP
jgi:hypothetical protein